jgi:SAM-dependent methyltransferase
MSKSHPSIYDSPEIFESYLKVSSEKELFVRRFEERFKPSSSPCLFLDLGCNDGTLTLNYLNAIKAKLPHTSKIVCVDPNKSALNHFKEKALPARLEFEFVPRSAEDYCFTTTHTFDWIIASHSLYWSPALKTLILKLVSLGKNVVIILREKDQSYAFEKKFRHATNLMYSGDTIRDTLNDHHIPFEHEMIEERVKIPLYPSDEYLLFLAFHLDMPLEQISKQLVLDAHHYLKAFNGTLTFNIGLHWIMGR